MKGYLDKITQLERSLQETVNPTEFKSRLAEIKRAYEEIENMWFQRLNQKTENLKGSIENLGGQITKLSAQITDVQARTEQLNFEMEGINNAIVDRKINLAILQYRKENLMGTLDKLSKELQISLTDLDEAMKKAQETGPQIVPMKTIVEILDEIRVTDGHLAALADVSEDIERMYESYSKLYLELKQKAQEVAENREKALEEVKTRMEAWKTVIKSLLDHVNLQYQGILSEAQAIGNVRLTNEHDIEAAGLEIFVGFKGAKPVPLNAYTQSGGERSTAIMSFLVALQQHVRSPFRAVDEYDIHMDPKNREIIANLLVSSVRGLDAQYLAITPSQVAFTGKDVHIITVQNIEGTSIIREMV